MNPEGRPTPQHAPIARAAPLLAVGLVWCAMTAALAAPSWALALAVLAVALPIWAGAEETAHLARRSLIDEVAREGGLVHRWLWSGRFLSAWHAGVALGLGALMLAAAPLLAPAHWWLLAADAALIGLAAPWVARRLETEVEPRYAGALARRWPLIWANTVLLAIGVFIVDYFFVGAPDSRGQDWASVVAAGYQAGFARGDSAVMGAAVGATTAADALAWHVAQTGIPVLPEPWARAGAWAVFLAAAGVLSGVATRVMLGAAALAEGGAARASLGRAWMLGVAAGAVALLLALMLPPKDAPPLAERGAELGALARSVDPCGEVSPDQVATQISARLASARGEAEAEGAAAIDAALETVFAEAHGRVGVYLDWWYSLPGEYQRLGALAGGDLAGMASARLETTLFGQGGLEARLAPAFDAVSRAGLARLEAEAATLGTDTARRIAESPCLAAALPEDAGAALEAHFGTPFSEGAVAAGALALRQAVMRATGRVATRAAFGLARRQAAKAALRRAAGRGGGALGAAAVGAAVCSPGGPLALACGVGAFVASWVAVDAAAIEIEEALRRDELEADLARALESRHAALRDVLRASLAGSLDSAVSEIESRSRVFIPSRDG